MKRFKGLYVPFVKWSIFFLLIHNLLFKIGILNEVYGNWTGGTTHPYSIHQFWQRLTNIVFSMGGYDEFLAGAFWFSADCSWQASPSWCSTICSTT